LQAVSKDYAGTVGGDEQMFGANQQVPHAGGCYRERRRQHGAIPLAPAKLASPVAGSALPVFYRPLEARFALKLSMSWHHPELYFFLCLLAGYAALLAIIYEGIQKFLRNRFRPRFTPGEVQRLEQRSNTRL